jgi:hypothetical protein
MFAPHPLYPPLPGERGTSPEAAEDMQELHKQLDFKPLPPRGRGWGEVLGGKYETSPRLSSNLNHGVVPSK